MNKVKLLLQHTFIRYGVMAINVVVIELISFWAMESLLNYHYLLATWISLFIGIVLNWVGSHYYVFGSSNHSRRREFSLVVITSLVGVLLQSLIVTFLVEVLGGPAIFGKLAAIVITFFWNYFVRNKYIYRARPYL